MYHTALVSDSTCNLYSKNGGSADARKAKTPIDGTLRSSYYVARGVSGGSASAEQTVVTSFIKSGAEAPTFVDNLKRLGTEFGSLSPQQRPTLVIIYLLNDVITWVTDNEGKSAHTALRDLPESTIQSISEIPQHARTFPRRLCIFGADAASWRNSGYSEATVAVYNNHVASLGSYLTRAGLPCISGTPIFQRAPRWPRLRRGPPLQG